MAEWFKVGDRVSWNSKGGRASGTIIRVRMRVFDCRGHTHHANPTLPRYGIKRSKTDHIAPHKGSALTRLRDRQIAKGDRREMSESRVKPAAAAPVEAAARTIVSASIIGYRLKHSAPHPH